MSTHFSASGQVHTCPLQATLRVISGQWKGVILWFLHHEKNKNGLRYRELKLGIDNQSRTKISDKMLVQSLKQLIEDDIICKNEENRRYGLTQKGKNTETIIEALEQFGVKNLVIKR